MYQALHKWVHDADHSLEAWKLTVSEELNTEKMHIQSPEDEANKGKTK